MTLKLVRLGVFLAFVGALALYIGLKLADVSFASRYSLSATFSDVTGLRNGDNVKLAGVPVGQVASIHLDDGRATVRFTVNRSVHLPTSTVAEIRWRNLIGQRYLSLDPGPDAATAKAFLATNGHGKVTKTKAAVDIGAVFNALDPLGQAINPGQLNAIFTSLSQALDGNDGSVQTLVSNLSLLSGTLADRDQTIQQMLTDYQTVTGVIGQRDQQIQTMVDNLVSLSQTFSDNTGLFERALGDLSISSTSIDQLLTANETQFRSLLDNVSSVANLVAAKLPEVESLLTNAPAAFKELYSAVNQGDFLRIDLTCLQFSPFPCTLLGGYSVP